MLARIKMKLFSLPDGFIDTHDRAQWLTPPFDGFNVILVDDTFTSTNTFTLTPNNVITVSESESSTNTFILTPNNVITVSESESSTNTFSSNIIVTFEASITNSTTNTFSSNIIVTFEASITNSSANTFTLTPNNVIGVSTDLDATGEFNEDIDRKSTRLNSSHLGISYAV